MRRAGRSEEGSALLTLMVVVLVCGGLAAGVLIPAIAESRAADASMARARAFQVAESGIDWGIAVVRRSGGAIPLAAHSQSVAGLGDFTITYVSGTANSVDDDSDGTTDEADESDYVQIRSTGTSGGQTRSVEVVLRRSVQVPQIDAAVQFNVATPILDLKGNSFLISGADHEIDGTEDPLGTMKPGIASPADVADLLAQIPLAQQDQVQGAGGTPSLDQVDAIDLASLVDQAKSAASIHLAGGTYSGITLGEPTEAGVVVVYADEDIHISGSTTGAGILIVDGDLKISGSFEWSGIVIVRGRVAMTGGGGTKRVIGGMVIGEEITSSVSESEVTVTGTVDLLYSNDAVQLSAQSLAVMSVLSWRETAAAAP